MTSQASCGRTRPKRARCLEPRSALWVAYYREVRYAGCDRANDGDMLLFQYGVYDWGDGSYVELDFVRQFIASGQSDDSQTEQLH